MAKIPPTCRPDIGHAEALPGRPTTRPSCGCIPGCLIGAGRSATGAIPVRQHGAVTGREPPVTLRSPARGPPPLRQHGTRPVV